MALHWVAVGIKNWDELKEIESFNDILQIIVFDTMNVGIPKITHGNVSEFYRRQIMLRMVRGYTTDMINDFMFKTLPLELLERFVGLASNASPKTVTQFNKDLLGELQWKTESAIERYDATRKEG